MMERKQFHFNEKGPYGPISSITAVSFRVKMEFYLNESQVRDRMTRMLRQMRVFFMMKKLNSDTWEFTLPLGEGFAAEMEKVESAMQQIEDEVRVALQTQASLKMLEGWDG